MGNYYKIMGKYEPITCEIQMEEFVNKVQYKQVVIFDFPSHYVRIEETHKYCEVITDFIYNKTEFSILESDLL